jgi:hypothetical protein
MDAQENPDFARLKAFAEEANIFNKQILQESDRGAALIGYAYLEELLKRLFKAKMLDVKLASDKRSKDLVEYPNPLSTSSGQADVAYALG